MEFFKILVKEKKIFFSRYLSFAAIKQLLVKFFINKQDNLQKGFPLLMNLIIDQGKSNNVKTKDK